MKGSAAQKRRGKKFRGLMAMMLIFAMFALPACSGPAKTGGGKPDQTVTVNDAVHQPDTVAFIKMLDANADLKAMFEKAIAKGKEINHDRSTNPAQNLEEYYSFLDWATMCMPWNIVYNEQYPTLLDSIDQSLNYF
jgi:hypothetical protein